LIKRSNNSKINFNKNVDRKQITLGIEFKLVELN